MVPMPQPGEVCSGFIAEPNRCWRMVYSRQLQATHCRERPSWTGRWFAPEGDRWRRVWACQAHWTGRRTCGNLVGEHHMGGDHVLDRSDHPSAIDTQTALTLCPVLDYKQQVKLAAKGLAERDNHPMPKFVTTPDAFYEVMAAAVLDAIDLPALLERVTRAERELEIIREALSRADIEAKNARHQPMIDVEASGESSIASISRGASTGSGPQGTENPRQSPLPRDPEHNDVADERRTVSAVPPPLIRSGQSKPRPCQQPKRPRRASRSALVNHFHSLSWRKLIPPIRSPLPQARYLEVRGLHVEGRARAWAERFKEPSTGAQPRYSAERAGN